MDPDIDLNASEPSKHFVFAVADWFFFKEKMEHKFPFLTRLIATFSQIC